MSPCLLAHWNLYTDTSRHLEAGVGWVSLAASREEGPRVFEDGSGDERTENTLQPTVDTGVTDVLVGVPSPSRKTSEEVRAASRTTPAELANERSGTQFVGELDTVLRARPLPPVCEKRLPLESQQSLGEEDDLSDMVESVEQPIDVLPPPAAPVFPVAASMGGGDLMSELRAQLSTAANEEIFSSDTRQCPATSEDEENSTLVGHEEFLDEDASGMAPGAA